MTTFPIVAPNDGEDLDPLWGQDVTNAVNDHETRVDALEASRILARGRRSTGSTTTTTEVGVLRLDDVPITASRVIKIWTSPVFLLSTVANDVVRAFVRHTTDGSTPTTSSTQLGAVQLTVPNTSFPPAVVIQVLHVPPANQTLSLLLTVSRQAGTGSVSLSNSAGFDLDFVIEDVGADTGDVGVDI